jgi:hypothetical protein
LERITVHAQKLRILLLNGVNNLSRRVSVTDDFHHQSKADLPASAGTKRMRRAFGTRVQFRASPKNKQEFNKKSHEFYQPVRLFHRVKCPGD